MKGRTKLLILVGLFISSIISAQDIHYTNYSYSPLYLSPANTGAFAGSYRFGINVRDQFSSFIQEPYQTLMAYGDVPLALGLKPYHWIGAGVNVFVDKAGDLNFKNTGAHLSLAYHYALDPKYKSVITLGVQYGMNQRDIDGEKYQSRETLSGNNDPDRELLDDFNPTVADLNIGVNFKRWTSKTAYSNFGISVYHLLQSEYSFSGSNVQNPVARRLNVFEEFYFQTSKQLAFRVNIVYSRMIRFQNLFGQLNLEYKPNKKTDTLIKGGVGFRTRDAIQFLGGVVYKGWDFGVAFDLTVSTAQTYTNGYGGLELGIKKILIVNRDPKIIPVILCPKY